MEFIYDCPNCGNDLYGDFGDDVYCKECDKTFETDFDEDWDMNITCWITKEIENENI